MKIDIEVTRIPFDHSEDKIILSESYKDDDRIELEVVDGITNESASVHITREDARSLIAALELMIRQGA